MLKQFGVKPSRKPSRSTHLSGPAFVVVVAGVFLVLVPFIVAQTGYTGKIMIADDRVRAPFDKTLILINRHGPEGAVGVILNKPLADDQRAHLSAFIRDAGIPVGYGGPLGLYDRIVVLEEKKSVTPGAPPQFRLADWDDAVRATPDLLNRIRQSAKDGEQRYRVFTGLASWSPLQLETEALIRNAWRTVPATHDLIFQNGDAARWDALDRQEKAGKSAPANQS